jgi:uncharacterized protein (DUF697 family)
MSLTLLKDIRRIYAGLNADSIRKAAHHDLNVGLVAASEEDYRRMEQFLAPAWGDDPGRAEALRTIHRVDGTPHSRFDFILSAPGVSVAHKSYIFDAADPAGMAKAIVADHEDVELALARNYPLFRRAVADRILHRVSRENALFALVTALPNVIPSFIDLPWALGEFATDTAFLTMNQIRMALLLAAVYGQTVGYAEQKLQIAAIAAGAFGWRALARELVGKIPLGGGLLPKAAVAFAGTYVVGMSLEKLNRTGSDLSRHERKDAFASAFARGKEVADELAPAVTRRAER